MRVLFALLLTMISSQTLAQSNEFFIVYIATNTSATPGASADFLVFDLDGNLYLGDNALDQGSSIMPTPYENEERITREIFLRNCLWPGASMMTYSRRLVRKNIWAVSIVTRLRRSSSR